MRRLDNIPFNSRVAILATIFIIPLLVVLWFFVAERTAVIATTQSELTGLRLLVPLDAVLSDLARSSNDTTTVAADLALLGARNDEVGDPLEVHDLVRRFLDRPAGPAASARLVSARALIDIISKVDEASGLSLDPGSNSYHQIELIMIRLPKMVLRNLELRAATASPSALPGDSASQLAFIAGRLDAHNQSFSESMTKSIAATPDPGVAARLAGLRILLFTANQELTEAATVAGKAVIGPAAGRAAQATAVTFASIGRTIESQLTQRLAAERGILFSRLSLVGFLVGAGAVFARITARSITTPVRAMTDAMASLAAGNVSLDPLPEARRDEIGRMAEALCALRRRLIEADWAKLERNDAIDAVSKSEAAFRLPFESNPLPMWVYDRETLACLDVNRATVEVYGWSRDQAVTMSVLDAIPPEDRERAREVISQRRKVRLASGPWTHLRANGSRLTVQLFSHAISFAGRDAVLVAAIDITEIKRLEDQLQQARKMEAVGQLAGGIAHDFNNILGAILGFAGFLVEDLAAGSAEHRFATRIQAAGERGRDLVRQILAFSRLETVDRQPTDLVIIARETIELVRSSIPASTTLALDEQTDSLIAHVNATHISQILMNLCINANDALRGDVGRVAVSLSRFPAGSSNGMLPDPLGLLTAETDAPLHRVESGSLAPSRPYALVCIGDTGVGMTREQLERIFEPFYTTKTRSEGTGLGLAIVHRIVLGYEGACHVVSRPGIGSLFRIYIPLTDEPVASPMEPVPRSSGQERVLVIDDETMITEMLEIGLTRLGYAVTTVNDPAEALGMYAASPTAWDVVVSDQVMPGVKGSALFTQMKAINAELRFILCTGYSDAMTKPASLATGIDAFFHKPVGPELLAATIRQLCGRMSGHEARRGR